MDSKDIRVLKMLEAVERNGETSQRALAENLHISLGLVNSCFRKLAEAGYFRGNLNSKGQVKYILTPKGVQEKARLTYQYILASYRLYKDAMMRLYAFFSELETRKIHRLAFFGVNDFAEVAYLSMKETSLEMVAVVDEEKKGQRFFGKVIGSVSMLGDVSFDRLLITDPEMEPEDFSLKTLSKKVYQKIISPPFQLSISHDIWSSS